MADLQHFDVAIIGGGPAGQAAAVALSGHGLSIAVIDEQPRPGGQILRQPPARFAVQAWLEGRSYAPLKQLLARFQALSGITWLGEHSVIGVQQGSVMAMGPEGVTTISARHILIAAGCQDLAVPVSGWTLPGVYAAGGIQAFLKGQQLLVGSRVLLAGTHPLQLLIAAQIVAAGGTVAAVMFAQPRSAMIGALTKHPLAALRRAPDLLATAGALRTLARAGTPVLFGAKIEALTGNDRVSGAITNQGQVACDAVGLCYGFVPQSAVPRMAGAQMKPAGPAGGWACVHDEWMRTSVPGIAAAGEAVGVAGAAAAAAGGSLAGIAIALDLGLIDADAADRAARQPRRALLQHRAFAALLDAAADPTDHFPKPAGDTIICRCEDVDHATLTGQVSAGGSANAIKLATRCGMGACQGRNCEPSLLRMIAETGPGSDPGFTARFPARQVSIADLLPPE
ncbi:FAD/NAD(P)-dependent oxidoreductase [Blastomonas aquatica]|uniref:Pyridine nucleotide-disulfide oxidoreductase n=1 Tax=Blastomonas aquatica TaxID=1510276 RepID=A0ABQ1J6N1_9SPHN|nr:NAD(P)/FAD-dependent oxidoreductase [Blastomonas aquatica]GGB61103.1 pyridine nucleotide-disulfide oxidoreductase [Blastomonas aquatica]